MSEPIRFNPLGDAALDDLIRRALIVELDRQPVPSAEVWQALVARIRIEQGLLTGRGKPAVCERGQEVDNVRCRGADQLNCSHDATRRPPAPLPSRLPLPSPPAD